MKPLVYIIIVNWNGIKDTIECLESLKTIKYTNYKVVLVDNGSKNNEGGKIKEQFPEIILIKNSTNTGFVVANNQGIKKALVDKADYVLLLNNDTVVSNNFLNVLVELAEKDKKIGVVTPKILYYKSDKIWSMGGYVSKVTGISRMIGKGKLSQYFIDYIEPEFATGCAFLVKTKILKKVGLLDHIYFAYYEDVDWSFRIRKAGYKIVTNPNSIIYHKKSASAGIAGTSKFSSIQTYYLARNSIIFAKTNLHSVDKIIYLIGSYSIRVIYLILNFNKLINFKYLYKGLVDGWNYEK